ncbi:peptidoglycan DD-metalloendopeptidase family protein [Staphylococcus xylosus]|uniref:peptidoglycan DD-metalloendopeptidase family protein n=1 Tax=Staphylococcus xylosus TaxID=1288 RepID=UPI002DBEC69B|nr:peptidoglycan DD-metalloendopeptidase family protein [Staphylococcus xylosus]MEB7659589.1 peptidoglycan DD-metalloendopeptidase family protein [Staphylococcus xylosus]MEB7709465.1 peptidoglycan DD-metalloendopeptidase family protein [Staphylococcus xylosus]MEB7785263.1 peptidoglycan DD-metalloendopeptidase family protein [Staphylococcus xylosus]
MAERIKGLQIDLSMKDMGVSKTLAGIKREFRSLDSSLKLSSNNFKYGEKSAASYKSRMNDLDGAIKSGTTNLNELEKQYNEVSQAQGSNSAKAVRLQTEYNKQANSINAMRDEYGRLNQYYKENFSLSGKLANKFSSIGESMSGVGQKAQDMGSSLTSSITKPALIAGTAMAGITAKLGFDRLVGLDSAKAKLEGLGYSTKEVGSITDQVAKAIQGGMTTMAEGTDVAAGALAAGVKEGKELQKYIKLVGDAAVGSNRPVSEMAMIFNRVQGQGKLMTEELNMVEEGMPGFSNAMAKHLGVSYDAFRKMVTEGEVSSKDFLTVMDDFAGGMAGAYSKSWSGMVQNTKAYIGQIGESLLGGVFEQAKGSLHEFESLLKSPGAQQWAKETGEKIGSAFSKLTSGISSVIKWWQSLDGGTQKTLGGIVKWLGITLVTMGPVLTIFGKFTSMIGGMFSGLSGLIKFFARHNAAAKISTASQALWNGVTATARGIANGYRYAIAALTTSQTAQAIKSKAAAAATVVWTGVTKAATVATRGLGLAIRFMTGPVGIVITAITALVGGIIYLWKTNSTFRNAVISAWNAIKKAAISVFGFIKPYIINIWNAIKKSSITVWNTLKKVATTTWNGIKHAIQNPIKALKNVLSTLWNGMKATAIKIWTLLKNGVVAIIKAYVNQARANFNLVKRIVVTIFNSIKSFAIKVWNAIKNGIINIVKVLRTRITNTFNALKNGIVSIFNTVKNFSLKLWTNIKNGVVSRAKSLWNGVKSMFTNLRNSVNSITSKIRNFLYSVWNAIKNKVVSLAKALWNGVKDKFNSLSTGTRKIFNAVRNYLVDKWTNIKDKVVGMATGIKDKVTGAFGVMRDSLKKIIGKITGFFDDMMGGVEKGLNSLIKGINKVGSMLGMGKEMIKPVKLSTGTEGASGNVVSNGAISSPTLATVNDSGPGNARGIGGYQELIQKSNGSVFAPQGKDAAVMLDKGDRVINGRTTAKLQKTGQIPKFSKGTGKNKKKDKNLLEQGWDAVNGTYESAKHGISKGMQKTGEALTSAGKFSKDWITKNIGDVMDWIKKPGKLLNKILDGMGVGMSSFGIKKGNVPYDLMGGMFKKLKSAATDLIKSWFEEAEGGEGDAGWLLKHDIWQKFGNYTGGLGFNGGKHYGIDFGMTPGTNVKAVAGGKVSKVWNDYGGGKSIEVDIGKGLTNWYMHLSKQLVSKGQKVGVGDLIAKSGNTGAFTAGSGHLHFQLNKNGKPQSNVLEWLKGLGSSGSKSASKWKGDIKRAAKATGTKLSGSKLNDIVKLIQTESNGDPKVTQHGYTDINSGGNEARGLLQYTPGTFAGYKTKGGGNILNGYHQLKAFFNNSNWSRDLASWKSRMARGLTGWGPTGSRRGYATGGLINSSGLYNLAEEGHPEFVIPTDPSRQSDAMKLLAIARQRIEGNKKNKRPNQMRTPSTGESNSNDNTELLLQMIANQQKQLDALMQIARSNKNIEQKPTGVSESDMSRAQGKRAQMMAYNMGGAF